MGSCAEEGCFYPGNGVARPTFLPLTLKRNTFFPSLPETPEHGTLYDTMVGITDGDVTNWELLSSSRYDVSKKYIEDSSSVFSTLPREENTCDQKPVTVPPCAGDAKNKKGLCSQWGDGDANESRCCSQWLRAYISKFWLKAPSEQPPETAPKPKQLTILEREFTFKQVSPKRLRRFSRKRHDATSQFVYAAFVEDTVVELREERLEDVVYSITIKRDGSLPRSGSLPKIGPSSKFFSDDDVMKEKNISRQLKGATLDFMVGRLAKVFVSESDDVNFLNVFLTTYRTFATPDQLFTKLHDEYMKQKDESSTKNTAVLKSIVRVLRAWLERYLADDFQEDDDHALLRRMLSLARVHDDVINENDGKYIERKITAAPASPLSPRKNGVVFGAGFADYVAAKLAVVAKAKKEAEASGSPLSSPTHTQNPSLDVVAEGSTLNSTAAKTLLNTLSSTHVATQLTVIAAKLFHRVQPHHCLFKNRPHTVRATIEQFNRVVYCVEGTILCRSLKLSQRTKLLTKWIEVAQECRELKNFSSLHAIASGLRTYALHRLEKAWLGVSQWHKNLLEELSNMNMKDLLLKVGTAKVNTEDSAITRVRKEATMRRMHDIHSGIMHGTVPYLGSFLTDLTYLDAARPDFLEGGLINFEKRRKEFELLAQLQLWQASCSNYQNLEPDPLFVEWFQSVTALTEKQKSQLSKTIEPPASNVSSPSHATTPIRRTLTEMIHSEAERSMSTTPIWAKQKKPENGVATKENKLSQSFSGRINTYTPSPCAQNRMVRIRLVRNKAKKAEDDVIDGKDVQASEDAKTDDPTVAECEYKTLSISADERRAAVIRRALELHALDVEANLKRFSLVQILQDKEIQIPDTANVFYAMSSSDQEPTLILLEEGAQIPHKVKRHQSTPHRIKKLRHRKNHSISGSLEPEPGRGSSISSAVSPLKSIYRQLAFNSVALVGGASYSPSDLARRQSNGEGEVAGSGDIVLLNSKSGLQLNAPARMQSTRDSMPEVEVQDGQQRTGRCYSADFASSVVLPIRVVRPSVALSAKDVKLPKSAPCSPQQERRNKSNSLDAQTETDVITATGRLVEWPRYTASVSNRSFTWSSRRALRKPKKTKSQSTFYVSKTLPSPHEDDIDEKSSESSRSQFYVDLETESTAATTDSKPPMPYHRSFSSNTLPSRLVPNFLGHDYDTAPPYRASVSVDASNDGTARWENTPVRKSRSFVSISSNQSQEIGANSDSGSGISFSAANSEDNVFMEVEKIRTDGGKVTKSPLESDSKSGKDSKAPVIHIQCASPENILDESGFFDRYSHGDNESLNSQSGGCENEEEHSTYL